MERTVVALFDNLDTAQTAVKQLLDSGFSRGDVSVVRTNQQGDYTSGNMADEHDASGAAAGAGIGAVLGGLAGLLVGLGALAIPGIGPIIAAGPLATTLAGAGLGAATGGLVGALADAGIPEKDAGAYAEGVRRGGTLVTVRADEDQVTNATEILNRFSPVDINQRAGEWQASGWSDSDTNSGPYSISSGAPHTHQANEMAQHDSGSDEGYVVDTGLRGENSGGVDEDMGSTTPADEDRTLRSGHGAMSTSEGLSAGEGGTYERMQEDATVHPRSSEGDYHARADFLGESTGSTEGSLRRNDAIETGTGTYSNEGRGIETSQETTAPGSSQGQAWQGQYGGHQGSLPGGQSFMGDGTSGRGGTRRFEDYDADFRNHWETNYRGSGESVGRDFDYERYQPAYQYGWQLGEQHSGQDWKDFEANARPEWERNHPDDAWQDFRPAIYYGWQQFNGGAGDAGQNQDRDAQQGVRQGAQYTSSQSGGGYDRTMSDMSRGFDTYDQDFRSDWQRSYGPSGYGYERYQPAYQYGYNLATDVKYRRQDWSGIEPEARRDWETRHPNDAWDEFKDAVRHAWDRVRTGLSDTLD